MKTHLFQVSFSLMFSLLYFLIHMILFFEYVNHWKALESQNMTKVFLSPLSFYPSLLPSFFLQVKNFIF